MRASIHDGFCYSMSRLCACVSERGTEEFAFIVVEIIVYFFVWLVRFVRVFNANFKLQVALILTFSQ